MWRMVLGYCISPGDILTREKAKVTRYSGSKYTFQFSTDMVEDKVNREESYALCDLKSGRVSVISFARRME